MTVMVNAVGRRHKLDIMADLLRLSKDGSKKTRLVYLANINFNMLKKYVTLLKSKGFIYNSDDLIYTSREGFDFLRKYDELMMAWDLMDNDLREPMRGMNSRVLMAKRRPLD
jgi:predicted transcriptional regulator